jgi:acetamidase/formamidase
LIHELPLGSTKLHGHFSRELPPVLTVDSRDAVRFALPNSGWQLGPGEALERTDPALDTGHALVGPIEVRGAVAGQTLAVRIDEVTPGAWGETYGGEGFHLQWELGDGLGRAAGRTVRLAPFLGVMGMPPAEPGAHPTIPPRPCGGNIDCKELVAGTTLYLPIPVDGALFSAGDGHAAQGDGEVSGTAIEHSLAGTFRFIVHKGTEIHGPRAEDENYYIMMGIDLDLDRAMRLAVQEVVNFLVAEKGLEPGYAYSLASIAVDFHVGEAVDQTQIVTGKIPKSIFKKTKGN